MYTHRCRSWLIGHGVLFWAPSGEKRILFAALPENFCFTGTFYDWHYEGGRLAAPLFRTPLPATDYPLYPILPG